MQLRQEGIKSSISSNKHKIMVSACISTGYFWPSVFRDHVFKITTDNEIGPIDYIEILALCK